MSSLTRRTALAGGVLLLPRVARAQDAPWRRLKDLEASSGARIGVAAIDTGSGAGVFWRESERFTMCSTFKLPLVASVLARVDAGREDLSRLVRYDSSALLGVSPVTTAHVASGLSVGELCEAAIRDSDNAAANLLLASLGGPPALTSWLRGLDDEMTRLDRNEPMLNVTDGDRDTTTPAAMLGTFKTILLGDALSSTSRARLMGWLAASTTGAEMLRAGLPTGWATGDKTGRGPAGEATVNDIAIVTPPGRPPLLIAVYTAKSSDSVVAATGRILADAFAADRLARG